MSRTSRDLLILAGCFVLLHTVTNSHYGFHRDELQTLDDARHLAWGYVAYPPLSPFLARIALVLFGPSLIGLRLLSALAIAAAIVLTGLMARDLGGGRLAAMLSAVAVAICPISQVEGSVFQYVSFDFLWWVVVAWSVIRLVRSGDPRWWLAIGAAAGLGMMTKYTMAFLAAGLACGILFSPSALTRSNRRTSPPPPSPDPQPHRAKHGWRWLWYGAALAFVILLPNLVWQIRHDFISLDFLLYIHARDIRIGRTNDFLLSQIVLNLCALPIWLAGLYYVFATRDGKPYRILGWMYIVPLLLFLLAKARAYYLAPAYPMLLAAGAVVTERWISKLTSVRACVARTVAWGLLATGGALTIAFFVPLTPVNSVWWKAVTSRDDLWREEVGWPDLVAAAAHIRDTLPPDERSHVGILVGNYGEAGAIDLYGPAYGLPQAISGTNSGWLRGYHEPAPETVIVLGLSQAFLQQNFQSCQLAGHNSNAFDVRNEETVDHPDIFVCRNLRQPWSAFWRKFKSYG